jgi:Undecaprenyl-phosphate glucose phosphotransferase
MKALPASSAHQRVSYSASDLLGHVRLSYNNFGLVAALSDVCAILVASMATGAGYHRAAFGGFGDIAEYFGVGVILAGLTVMLMRLRDLYAPDRLLLPLNLHAGPILFIWGSVIFFLLAASFALKISADLSRGWIISLAFVAPSAIFFQRALLRRAMGAIIERGWLRRRKIAFITDASLAPTIYAAERAYEVTVTYVLPEETPVTGSMITGFVNSLRGKAINEVHLAIDWRRWWEVKRILTELRALPFPVRLIADKTASEILHHPQQTLFGAPHFEVQRAPLTAGERVAKRLFDIVGAGIGLLLAAPLLLAVALAIRMETPGTVLFWQKRGGFNGREFEILKFRTMHVMEDGPAIAQATRDDGRVTWVGRWLRRFSIDELPQLINVIRGDMSLVGPRPHAIAHDEQYSALIANYPYRHHVKPGITGWAQVHGLRGETPTVTLMKQRVELDLWYVRNWSFWLDVRILFWTSLEICRQRNAF